MVVALLALFIALDGPATAARLIDGRTIKRNSITNAQVRNRTLGTQDLSKQAVKALEATPSRSVGAKQLREGAVTAPAIAAKAIDTSKVADGAVGNTQLAGSAVDASKLADGAVGPTKLAADAVTSSKVADGAIGAAAIADGGLQTSDLADFYGAATINFATFEPTSCQVNGTTIQPQPAITGSGAVIGDDVIIVTPPVGWPDQLIVTGHPGASNTLRIVACNPTGTTIAVAEGVVQTFQYTGIDQP
jgi:hypothetical protein